MIPRPHVILLVVVVTLSVMLGGCSGHSSALVFPPIGWAAGSSADNYGTIIHTEDGGKNWVRQGSATTIPDCDLEDVRAVDAQRAWAVGTTRDGSGVILHTVDGGKTWTRMGDPGLLTNADLSGVCPVDDNIVWISGSPGVVLLTTDGGQTWTVRDTGYPEAVFQMIAAADAQTAWAVGATSENGDGWVLIAATTDGGTTWERQGSRATMATQSLIDVHALDNNHVWAVGTGLMAVTTRNGGATWLSPALPGGPLHLNGVCAVNVNTAWIAADYGKVWRTTDGGWNWSFWQPQLVGHGATHLIGVSAPSDRVAWIVGGDMQNFDNKAVIVHTSDGGDTWEQQTSPANSWLRRVSFVGAHR